MIVHQVFAQIFEEEIKNIIVCDDYSMANYLARATYGDEAFAVDCLQWRCCIGGKYIGNRFYEPDGETLTEYIETQEQHVQSLQRENNALQDEVSNTQLALTELYETKGV